MIHPSGSTSFSLPSVIIMFQDILTPLEPMGAGFQFKPGPVLEHPVTSLDSVHQLKIPEPARDLKSVGRILRQ